MSCYGIEDTLEAMKGRVLDKGDCCSSSRLIDVQMRSYSDAPLSGEIKEDETTLEDHPDDERVVLYHTRFLGQDGRVALSVLWMNGSNGYYGGYWVNA